MGKCNRSHSHIKHCSEHIATDNLFLCEDGKTEGLNSQILPTVLQFDLFTQSCAHRKYFIVLIGLNLFTMSMEGYNQIIRITAVHRDQKYEIRNTLGGRRNVL